MQCKQKGAKKRSEPPKRRSCPSQFSECPCPMVPISFCSGCNVSWGTHNALTSTRTSHQQITTLGMSQVSNAEVFTLPTRCIASKREQEKAMNPESVEDVLHSSLSARPQWSQFPLQRLRRPPEVQIMPSLPPGLPISRLRRLKCHPSAVQRFSPYQLHALQATESKKRQ